MSGLMQQVMYQLGIKQYKSAAYHPESQGALERFHQTLKKMLCAYCLEHGKDWDEGVHLVLFASREAVHPWGSVPLSNCLDIQFVGH